MLIKARSQFQKLSYDINMYSYLSNVNTFFTFKLFQASNMGWSYYLLPVPICQKSIKLPIFIHLKILGKVNPYAVFAFCYTIRPTSDCCYWLKFWNKTVAIKFYKYNYMYLQHYQQLKHRSVSLFQIFKFLLISVCFRLKLTSFSSRNLWSHRSIIFDPRGKVFFVFLSG